MAQEQKESIDSVHEQFKKLGFCFRTGVTQLPSLTFEWVILTDWSLIDGLMEWWNILIEVIPLSWPTEIETKMILISTSIVRLSWPPVVVPSPLASICPVPVLLVILIASKPTPLWSSRQSCEEVICCFIMNRCKCWGWTGWSAWLKCLCPGRVCWVMFVTLAIVIQIRPSRITCWKKTSVVKLKTPGHNKSPKSRLSP